MSLTDRLKYINLWGRNKEKGRMANGHTRQFEKNKAFQSPSPLIKKGFVYSKKVAANQDHQLLTTDFADFLKIAIMGGGSSL
jgi:hypothetical protein